MVTNNLTQLDCLKEACKRLGISYTAHDAFGNLISVFAPSGVLHFANFSTPFNSGAAEQICKDKGFTALILGKHLSMPKSRTYTDPGFREGYDGFKKHGDLESIVRDIEKDFSYPVVIKKNTGTRGINVFLCQNSSEAENALSTIFKKDSLEYDYGALVQEYIRPVAEYRAVRFFGKTVFLYRTKSLWSSPTKKPGEMPAREAFEALLAPVQALLPLAFFGADVIEDANGKLWLLELNTRPGFANFIRENGTEPVISLYEKMLTHKS